MPHTRHPRPSPTSKLGAREWERGRGEQQRQHLHRACGVSLTFSHGLLRALICTRSAWTAGLIPRARCSLVCPLLAA